MFLSIFSLIFIILQMSSNILANTSTNDPAAQHALKELMNLRFTLAKPKVAHHNIKLISAWITIVKHRPNLLLNLILAGAWSSSMTRMSSNLSRYPLQ